MRHRLPLARDNRPAGREVEARSQTVSQVALVPGSSGNQAPNSRADIRQMLVSHGAETMLLVKGQVAGVGGFEVTRETRGLSASQSMLQQSGPKPVSLPVWPYATTEQLTP